MNKKDVLLVCALRKETQGQLTDWLGGDDWEGDEDTANEGKSYY